MHRVHASVYLYPSTMPGHLPLNEPAAALPDPIALNRRIEVFYPATQRRMKVFVRDVGPTDVRDPYWLRERGPDRDAMVPVDPDSKRRYRLGMSLSPAAWRALGVPRSRIFRGGFMDEVFWRFLDEPCAPCHISHGIVRPSSPFLGKGSWQDTCPEDFQ